jgi:hypothetical protein
MSYTDRTPISDILPKQVEHIEEKVTVPETDVSLEQIFQEIENDEVSCPKPEYSIMNKVKKYLKVVLILALLYIIISSGTSLNIFKLYSRNLVTVKENTTVASNTGMLVQGLSLGIIYVVIELLLNYVLM